MKYTTLLALSSFIVFQGYAVGHQAGWVEGRRCITNYGVPTQAEVKEYITTPNLEKAVLDGKITNEMVLDDLYNASMGVKKVSENQKKAFIERHVKVQEVFFYTMRESFTVELRGDFSKAPGISYKERFYRMLAHCGQGDSERIAKQPVEDYLDDLYSRLMAEAGLNN